MKKLLTVIAVLALLFPVSAMAGMTAITDSEMGDVTGQVGIDIAVVDFSMQMSIANIAWGDGDSGTVVASCLPVAYTPGYINLGGLDMYIYVTLAGTPISALGGHFVAAQPLGIDILTAADARLGGTNPYEATWGVTGILISIPDMYITIDDLSLAGIYLTGNPGGVTSDFNYLREIYDYDAAAVGTPCQSLGSLTIEGIEVQTFSSVPETADYDFSGVGLGTIEMKSAYKPTAATLASERWHEGNRALVIIAPHCKTPIEYAGPYAE